MADNNTQERNARKVREGLVVSNKMNQTAVIAVVERVRHAKYDKFVIRTKKLYAHDETNDVNIGDRVRVMEIRPMSKLKRWRIIEVLERAKRFSKSLVSALPTTVAQKKYWSSRFSVERVVVTHPSAMYSSQP